MEERGHFYSPRHIVEWRSGPKNVCRLLGRVIWHLIPLFVCSIVSWLWLLVVFITRFYHLYDVCKPLKGADVCSRVKVKAPSNFLDLIVGPMVWPINGVIRGVRCRARFCSLAGAACRRRCSELLLWFQSWVVKSHTAVWPSQQQTNVCLVIHLSKSEPVSGCRLASLMGGRWAKSQAVYSGGVRALCFVSALAPTWHPAIFAFASLTFVS